MISGYKKNIVVAAALIDMDSRILIAKRPKGKPMAGFWELPGGKIEKNELPEAALVRELQEELGIDISASCLSPFTFSSHAYEEFHLIMLVYVCRTWAGNIVACENQELKWVDPIRLNEYPMPPADIPIVAMLRDFL